MPHLAIADFKNNANICSTKKTLTLKLIPSPTMQDFFQNVSRYPRYFITFTLGIFFFLFERLKPLLNRPVTAIALVGLLVSIFAFTFFTLRAMLGLNPV